MSCSSGHTVDLTGGRCRRQVEELISMKFGLLARIDAKPEHADEIAALLASAGQMARKEGYAKTWYAFRTDATTFGVFDTFDDDQSRTGHLEGQIAAALTQLAEQNKLATPLDIRPVDLLSTTSRSGA
jgi:hypothetical protein